MLDTCERLAQGPYSATRRTGVEPATCWWQVHLPNHYAIPSGLYIAMVTATILLWLDAIQRLFDCESTSNHNQVVVVITALHIAAAFALPRSAKHDVMICGSSCSRFQSATIQCNTDLRRTSLSQCMFSTKMRIFFLESVDTVDPSSNRATRCCTLHDRRLTTHSTARCLYRVSVCSESLFILCVVCCLKWRWRWWW